jgi:hypothetical protein
MRWVLQTPRIWEQETTQPNQPKQTKTSPGKRACVYRLNFTCLICRVTGNYEIPLVRFRRLSGLSQSPGLPGPTLNVGTLCSLHSKRGVVSLF